MNNSYYNNNRGNSRPVNNSSVPKEIPELNEKTYVKQAEDVIGKLKIDNRSNKIGITSSQIRNLLTLINEVYNLIQHDHGEKLSDEVQSRAQYIKMRIAYSAGREPYVNDFVKKSNIMTYIDRSGDSRKKLMLVCNYMEALVAYHKFIRGNVD